MSKQRAKGTQFETLVLEAFKQYHPDAHRLGLQGVRDCGDIWLPASVPYIVEAKNEASYAGKLSTWLKEAEVEARNAGKPHGIVVHKKRGSAHPADQYVTANLFAWLELTSG